MIPASRPEHELGGRSRSGGGASPDAARKSLAFLHRSPSRSSRPRKKCKKSLARSLVGPSSDV